MRISIIYAAVLPIQSNVNDEKMKKYILNHKKKIEFFLSILKAFLTKKH